jgi:hypothetical protein
MVVEQVDLTLRRYAPLGADVTIPVTERGAP